MYLCVDHPFLSDNYAILNLDFALLDKQAVEESFSLENLAECELLFHWHPLFIYAGVKHLVSRTQHKQPNSFLLPSSYSRSQTQRSQTQQPP